MMLKISSYAKELRKQKSKVEGLKTRYAKIQMEKSDTLDKLDKLGDEEEFVRELLEKNENLLTELEKLDKKVDDVVYSC